MRNKLEFAIFADHQKGSVELIQSFVGTNRFSMVVNCFQSSSMVATKNSTNVSFTAIMVKAMRDHAGSSNKVYTTRRTQQWV